MPFSDSILTDRSVRGVYVAVKAELSLIPYRHRFKRACTRTKTHTTLPWPGKVLVCAFVCYKTKRWTLSCLKALLGVSGALSHVMLLVPLSTTHIYAYWLYQHKPEDTVHIFTLDTHINRELRHTLRRHHHSAFTAYYLRPITAQQSFVLPLFCRASYSTKRKQMRHSTNGWLVQIFCNVSH